MRLILLFLFVVGFCAGLACQFPTPLSGPEELQIETPWRRTEEGWVHVDSLESEAKPNNRQVKDVHPGILAGLQALISIGALVLFTEFPPHRSAAVANEETETPNDSL